MTDDIERVRTSEHASASSHDVFVERLRSRSARADARATERATQNHDVALDVVASEAEAYGAYVALMRSGLWLDVAFARDHASGVLYAACEPRATPTERRKDEPREARPRTIAVPFAVTRACVTPSFFDVVTSIADRERWPFDDTYVITPATPRLLIMLDSDGTMTTCALSRDFVPPKDIQDDALGAGDAGDSDDDALATRAIPHSSAAVPLAFSDGDSEDDLLENANAVELAVRHARPAS